MVNVTRSTGPTVTLLNVTDPQGLGENVTIYVNITEPASLPLNNVWVQITPPGGSPANYTMWNITKNIWLINNFTDWENGSYAFTVYANDTGGATGQNSSNFTLFANLTVQL